MSNMAKKFNFLMTLLDSAKPNGQAQELTLKTQLQNSQFGQQSLSVLLEKKVRVLCIAK